MQKVVLMHLSETNNHPDIAKITARQALGECPAEMVLALQNEPTELFEITKAPSF